MAWDGAGQLFAVRTRITRLTPTGLPAAGETNMLVTSALTRLQYTPTKATGQLYETRNGAADVCLSYQAPDKVTGTDVQLQLCTPDPRMTELLSGGVVLMDGTDPVGYAAPEVGTDPTPNGVSVEVWTRAILDGDSAPDLPFVHWVFPRIRFSPDQAALEANPMTPTFTGRGTQNAQWGDGPVGDWEHTSDRLWQWARVADLPEESDDYVTVPAQTP